MNLYKNILTGELYIADNHTRAFIYFYEKSGRDEKPEGKDIAPMELDINTDKINLPVGGVTATTENPIKVYKKSEL